MNNDYIKDYRDKELRQYILATFLVLSASIGLGMLELLDKSISFSALLEILSFEILEGAICILVSIFTELWGNKAKIHIVYSHFPSDTIFTEIENGTIYSLDYDTSKAKTKYRDLSNKSREQQTETWNKMLLKARKDNVGSVIEAERSQLLTRDLCITTLTLFVANIFMIIISAVIGGSFLNALKLFSVSFVYLLIMFLATRIVANSKAKRLICLVIKNDLLSEAEKSNIILESK